MKNNIKLRDLKIEDLEQYYELKHPSKLHNQYNGPYLGIISEEELKGDIEYFREEFLKGNPQPYKGMLRLAEKLGLQLEATYRKARIYKGKYYDSVSYGILREEWEQSKDTSKLL